MNTLLYTKKLEQLGVSREDAEAHITVYAEMIMKEVATRKDLDILQMKMEKGFSALDSKMEKGFSDADRRVDNLYSVTQKMISETQVRTLGTVIACTSLIIGAIAILK